MNNRKFIGRIRDGCLAHKTIKSVKFIRHLPRYANYRDGAVRGAYETHITINENIQVRGITIFSFKLEADSYMDAFRSAMGKWEFSEMRIYSNNSPVKDGTYELVRRTLQPVVVEYDFCTIRVDVLIALNIYADRLVEYIHDYDKIKKLLGQKNINNKIAENLPNDGNPCSEITLNHTYYSNLRLGLLENPQHYFNITNIV